MNSDLFQLIKQNKLNSQTKFWGYYEHLNNPAGNVSDNVLLRLQVARLRALSQHKTDLIEANSFLEWAKTETGNSTQNQDLILDKSTQQIYSRIVQLLNSALWSSPMNPKSSSLEGSGKEAVYKDGESAATVQAKEQEIIAELDQLLQLIQSSKRGEIINTVKTRFRNGNNESGKQAYIAFKAKEAEELAIQALVSSNSNWRGLVSGQLYNKGQQLLQDGFVFPKQNVNFGSLLNVSISSTNNAKNSTKVGVGSLDEFFQLYENLSGNYSISLSDELYEKLQEISIMSVQAKSGIGAQSLLNATIERNATSLNDLGITSSLKLLMDLYKLGWVSESAESNTLSAIANYCLSKSIAFTNITKNSIYFTSEGFVTAPDWMERHQQMLKFHPNIKKVYSNLLDKKNSYIFTSANN